MSRAQEIEEAAEAVFQDAEADPHEEDFLNVVRELVANLGAALYGEGHPEVKALRNA